MHSEAMRLHEITRADDPAWNDWKAIYFSSFPEAERMSEAYFLNMFADKVEGEAANKHLLAVMDAGGETPEVVGIVYYETETELAVAFLWYVAVRADKRGRGYGSEIYNTLVSRLKAEGVQMLVFEVEMPEKAASGEDRALAERRISWYRRQGAFLLGGVQYFQSVDTPVEPTEMHIMAHPFVPMTAQQVFEIASEMFGDKIKQTGLLTLE